MFIFVLQYQYIRKQQIDIFVKSEKASDEKVIDKVLEFKAAGFLKPTKDNSAWDEMLEFTETKDTAWARENLEAIILTFGMSYMGAFDTNGNAFYTFSDSSAGNFKISNENITDWFSKEKTISCFVKHNNNLFEIFGAAIVPSFDINYKTKPHGYLISVKRWDDDYISDIANTTGFNLELSTSDLIDSSNKRNDEEIIYKQLKDFRGNTIATLKFFRLRTFAAQVNYLNLLAIISLCILIISLVLFFIFINRWINNPMKIITRSLSTGSQTPIEKLVNKKNEFGEIARLIKRFNQQKDDLINEVNERTRANEKYKALLMAQPDLMFTFDRQGIFLDYYAPNESELFKAPSDFLGKSIIEVFPFDFVNEINTIIKRISKTDAPYTIEYQLEMHDGIHYNEARFVAIDDSRILSVVRDITSDKKVKKELIFAKEKAQESDRLKSAFLANMSHEIRTPMHAILGFSRLLEDESLPASEKAGFISIINKSGEELLTLINDIIDISKIDSNLLEISKSSFNLNNLMDQLLITFESEKIRLKKNDVVLKMEKFLENKVANVVCDNVRLGQVLKNLIGNALKFTNNGHIRFGYRIKDNYLLFYVEDTGKGIASNNHELIFERFRQEDESNERNYGGAGLGLPISKGIVELMGGKIWMESTEGKGSTFYFTLPSSIITNSNNLVSANNSEKTDFDFSGKTIIVAEDVIENFELIKIFLRKTNATLIYAENGSEAIEKFKSTEKTDLILMDIRMPVMNGYDAAREIKRLKPNVPIIALTAHAFSEEKARCLEVGCDDFISKPIDGKSLLLVIEKFLGLI